MGIDFYYMPLSAPCRGILLTAKAIGVRLNLKPTTTPDGVTPEFLKMSIRRTILTANDDGSVCLAGPRRAAMQYLMNKYAPDNELYPKDPQKRAKVDDILFFDCSVLYDRFGNYVYPVAFGAEPSLNDEKKARFEEGLEWLDHYIKTNGGYVAGVRSAIHDK